MVEVEKVKSEVHDEIPKPRDSLIMRRIPLRPQQGVHEPDKRGNLFKTRCKTKCKCCKLIIDNGSINNLVSTEMVEKLGLKKIPHPTPYRVGWIQKGHQVLVNEQC